MITAFIFLGSALVLLGLYLWHFKDAEIQICFTKGIIIGMSLDSPELEDVKTHYLDIFLGLIIISIIWDEEC